MSRPAIFVSYRRHGEADAVGRICDRLIERFGAASVFQDVNDIPAGADFGVHILEKIAECRVLLAMIDSHWGASVLKRQHDQDWVREELMAAKKLRLHIIPVVLGNTKLPLMNELPEALRWLVSLEATKVRGGRDFRTDFENLTEQLSRHVPAMLGARGAAAELWDELGTSEDTDRIELFVETFNNSREAFHARGRLKQLKQLFAIRERMEPYYHWDEIPEVGTTIGFDASTDFFETLRLVDDFLDAPATEWHAEVVGNSEKLRELARDCEPYDGFSSDYDDYREKRHLKGKPER